MTAVRGVRRASWPSGPRAGEELSPLPLALFLSPRGRQPFMFLSIHPSLMSSLTSSSLNTSSTMSSILMINS